MSNDLAVNIGRAVLAAIETYSNASSATVSTIEPPQHSGSTSNASEPATPAASTGTSSYRSGAIFETTPACYKIITDYFRIQTPKDSSTRNTTTSPAFTPLTYQSDGYHGRHQSSKRR
ncbi:hypothetical protein UPYG_G00028660 [Umbra pygmaea]|uniref:Uncharacterized protein n=1 Tax=Umbra pygmaea TaxID=75934 RepID=A0ABD0XMC9_UMBPY